MPMICVCVEALFGKMPIADKARKVAEAGFRALEFWSPEGGPGKDLAALRAACKELGLIVNDFGVATGGALLVNAADRDKYLDGLRRTIPIAKNLDCRKLITTTGNAIAEKSREEQHRAIVDTLKAAAPIAAQAGIVLLLEPLNSLVDHRGYYLDSGHEAAQIIEEVGSPAVRLLWDIYHMQIMHGNVLADIQRYLPLIGHFHSAGVPGRHDLDVGELNYSNILAQIKAWGYDGCFGLEYWPAGGDDMASLKHTRELTAAAGWE
jgi:hydroxypyruvate isomerase